MPLTQAVAVGGIYDLPNAARYLAAGKNEEITPLSSRTLIRWIRSGLAHRGLQHVSGRELLISFEDLISMRVIAVLRASGVTWPQIRKAEAWLREFTGHQRPFAIEEIWTIDTLNPSDLFARWANMVIATNRHGQLALENMKAHLIPVSGLTFEHGIASIWEPQELVTLDPDIQFGAPCIKGTRIPTRSVWGMVAAGDPPKLVTSAYNISEEELAAALAWEEKVAAA